MSTAAETAVLAGSAADGPGHAIPGAAQSRAGQLRLRGHGPIGSEIHARARQLRSASSSELVAILGPNASGKSTLLRFSRDWKSRLRAALSGRRRGERARSPNACPAHRPGAAGKRTAFPSARLGIRFAGTLSSRPAPAV